MELKIIREGLTDCSTYGKMYVDEMFYCYTLEDIVRRNESKVFGKTAIPAGEYYVSLTYSNRFKKNLAIIHNIDKLTVEVDNKVFLGVRFHGGNTSKDTEGCILIASKRIDFDRIQDSKEKLFTGLVERTINRGEKVTLQIIEEF